MIRECYEKVMSGENIRESLALLREQLLDETQRRAFAYLLGGDFSVLCSLLKHEDPKVRRNTARILGQMESEDLLPELYEAYEKEQTRFIRADYLKAMAGMDCEAYVEQMESRLEKLRKMDAAPEEKKHVSEEMRMLQMLVMKYQKKQHHIFEGQKAVTELVLVTNRCQREVTARQILKHCQVKKENITLLAGGVKVRGAKPKDIFPIRTYSEMLFPIDAPELPGSDPEGLGRLIAEPLQRKLEELHEPGGVYAFRIELKGTIASDKKGAYIRKISDALEKSSEGKLINSVTDYEAELRLLEKKDGSYVPMLKLYTIQDKRFAYRKEVIASSITPVNAALTMELARPWMKEGTQILDPFCGVGTMLIERNKAMPAGIMYGIDIYGEAIEKARNNGAHAGCRINYINKDFMEFEHGYLFDEVITNLPQVTAQKSRQEIEKLYRDFLKKIAKHLKKEAVLIVYVQEVQIWQSALQKNGGYDVEKKYLINEKKGTSVYIMTQKKH